MYIFIFSISVISLIILTMIFFIIYRKQRIIEDTGFVKSQLLYIGLILFFSSLNFSYFTDYNDCAIKFLIKHSGVLLIIIVFSIFIANGSELGLSYGELEYLDSLKCSRPLNSYGQLNNCTLKDSDLSVNVDKSLINNIEKELNKYRNKEKSSIPDVSKKRTSNIFFYNKGSSDNLDMKKVNQSIFIMHSFSLEVFVSYIIVFILLIVIIIYNKNNNNINNSTINNDDNDNKFKDNDVQDSEGKWRYECPLNRMNLIFNMMDFVFIIFLLAKAINIWNYTYVFKCLKSMGYAIIIWITIGPIINVNKCIQYKL